MDKTDKQVNYLAPFITLVILFFFVGFLTTANGQFQGPLKSVFLSEAGDLKNTFATLISFVWFLAYPLTGGIGASWVTKYGYKRTLLQALVVLMAGLLIFWLSAVFTIAYPDAKFNIASARIPWGFVIFLIGSYVVGAAATILQVVINPYLTACNVKNTQPVQRLNIGGSSKLFAQTDMHFFFLGVFFFWLYVENLGISTNKNFFLCRGRFFFVC